MPVPALVERGWAQFRRWLGRVGTAVQNVVLSVLLALTYLIGFGLTRLVAMVAFRHHLRLYDQGPPRESYWRDAEGYGGSRTDLQKQT